MIDWSFEFKVFDSQMTDTVKSLKWGMQIQKPECLSSCLAAIFAQSIEARCEVENENVVGAAQTGDAPTTSEWATI